MSFWDLQERAQKKTALYLILFLLITVAAAVFVECVLRFYMREDYVTHIPIAAVFFVVMTCGAAMFQYIQLKAYGGKYVAESMGAYRINPETEELKERQLLNIVEEIAIASSMNVPAVYVIEAGEINAFAAGLEKDDCVVAVTKGALANLSRDEMQAVIAHEFGHIVNEDMKIGLRLSAMLMGFYFILYLALRIFQFSPRKSSKKEGNGVVIVALVFFIAGVFTWLFGSLLKACVSRQREYLADASSVQYTRNPQGLIGALKKISQESAHDMPKSGMAYAHLYFDDHSGISSLFSSHPPIKKRIQVLENLL